jgi:hypothetical protein
MTERAGYFNFLIFVKTGFATQNMIYYGESSKGVI